MRIDVGTMADWSPWISMAEASPPALPGVYLARRGVRPNDPVVYVGHAGERKGRNGLAGRFGKYASGFASGLARHALNAAIADPQFVRERLAEAERGQPRNIDAWGLLAQQHVNLHVCWATTRGGEPLDGVTASLLEREIWEAYGSLAWTPRAPIPRRRRPTL